MVSKPPISPEATEQKTNRLRVLLHSAIPAHFENPLGLTSRILQSRNRDAYAAAFQAGLRLASLPLDLALAKIAGSDSDEEPQRPMLFVTGPPRSGTTLLHQVLIKALPVAYVTNLASLLPRSAAAGAFPLTRAIRNDHILLESFYGRTRALSGPSDGLEFWDSWIGTDRRSIPQTIAPDAATSMRTFFGRLERKSGLSVIAKNNNLLGSAHLVASALPTARFVCLRRDPVYLGQSLLKARRDIHGSAETGYGIDHLEGLAPLGDHLEDVRQQVRFYQHLESVQKDRIGDRFKIVGYEDLCRDPNSVVTDIARNIFHFETPPPQIPPLQVRERRTLESSEFEKLASLLNE